MDEIIKQIMEEADSEFGESILTAPIGHPKCHTELLSNPQKKFWIESIIKILKKLKTDIDTSQCRTDEDYAYVEAHKDHNYDLEEAIQLLKTFIN